jgi:hypothetical protein
MASNNNYATRADLKEVRDELVQVIHGSETRLLKAFYGFAEATQKRMDNLENGQGGLTGIIATLDRRVTEIEKRLNSPNAS